jgi:hypothetical protein
MKVGIAGHQNIGSDKTIKWVSSVLAIKIKEYSIDFGFTSLAVGSDQLFAQLLRQSNIPYTVVIPCGNYEKTFTDTASLENYQSFLDASAGTFQLPFPEPSETAFYEAGKEIVYRSDMIFAIWDGLPAKGLGGTGDIVKYARTLNKSVIHINPASQTVSSI